MASAKAIPHSLQAGTLCANECHAVPTSRLPKTGCRSILHVSLGVTPTDSGLYADCYGGFGRWHAACYTFAPYQASCHSSRGEKFVSISGVNTHHANYQIVTRSRKHDLRGISIPEEATAGLRQTDGVR